MKKHSEISDAIKEGKAPVDTEVENALLKSALGFKETVKKCIVVGNGGSAHIEEIEEEIYVQPNTTAQIFWLKNRKPELWRDRRENAVSLSPSDLDESVRRMDEYFKKAQVESSTGTDTEASD